MSNQSRQRKSQIKRSPETPDGKSVVITPAANKPWQITAVCVVLVLVTLVAYHGVRNNDFVDYDDHSYVVENPHIQQGFTTASIEWAFTTFDQSNWHPFTWLSHMVDWSLYGNSPLGHHMTNVVLHTANSILLFLLLFYMTGYLGRSAVVAFLFALHPAHVESVAWISERKDVLCAFFFLTALLAYVWYVRRPSWKRYASVVIAFAFALMSKPMAVTLPFTLLLLDIWPLRRIIFTPETRAHWLPSFWKLCVEKWPLFMMSVLSSVITFIAQHAGHSISALDALPLWVRILNAAISYCRYIRIMVWPYSLRAYYYYNPNHTSVIAAVLSAIALILVTALCWHYRKAKPYCLAGWLWFLGTLVPVIGIVQVGEQAMAERYTYIPFIGLFIAMVWLIGDAVANSPKIKLVTQLLVVAVLAACAVKTNAQVKVWKDTVTLFSHVLQIDLRGDIPNSSMGLAYAKLGRFAEAQQYFERALVYHPFDSLTLSYSAYCIMQTVMQTHDPSYLPLAGQRLELALRMDPEDRNALADRSLWFTLMGRPKDAETYSRKALAVRPDNISARLYLADALRAQDKLEQAVQEYRQVIALDPDNYSAYNNLGIIYDRQGFKREALKEFRLSLAFKPDQAMPHYKIGKILTEMNQFRDAVDELTQAVRLDPGSANAHNGLGVALFQLGDHEKAVEQFNDAIQIDPTFAEVRRNLDIAQAQTKK
jgi:tetratricopeptide (TPR) repeat protein